MGPYTACVFGMFLFGLYRFLLTLYSLSSQEVPSYSNERFCDDVELTQATISATKSEVSFGTSNFKKLSPGISFIHVLLFVANLVA